MCTTISDRAASKMKFSIMKWLVPTFWLLCLSGVTRASENFWSRVISAEPMSSADRAQDFSLFGIRQQEHLGGTWYLSNGAVKGRTSRPVEIPGVETPDGVFWPDVTLQVKNEATTRWETVTNSIPDGKRTARIVAVDTVCFSLTVNLDACKAFLGRYKFGRIILKSGEVSEFELKYLEPPKNDHQ